jgi:formiminoglutamase
MKLPLLLSVPHAGAEVPPLLQAYSILTEREIIEDGDEGAAEIYALEDEVAAFLTSSVARAFVDLNRPEDDRERDGVVKTHTCWDVPVYREHLPEQIIRELLRRYYHPYHRKLQELARPPVRLGIDCHTMAAVGPSIGPGAGAERPAVCLSNGEGTCPVRWIREIAECFEKAFGREVRINDPFRGGFIVCSRPGGIPWVQLEISRAPFLNPVEKRQGVLDALRCWCVNHPDLRDVKEQDAA